MGAAETEGVGRLKAQTKENNHMKIKGIEGMLEHELSLELERGGKFVIFQYCISAIVVTFKRSSDIYFVRANENPVRKGIGFTIITLLFGWWGIPWGPIFTLQVLAHNLSGSWNVTQSIAPKVIASLAEYGTKPFQICPKCSTRNDIDASFCENCNQPLKFFVFPKNTGGRVMAVVLTALFVLLGVAFCYAIYVEGF